MKAMEISMTGLDVEWRRLEVIAQNLANANTAISPTGAGFHVTRLVSGPKTGFAGHLNADDLGGVAAYGLEPVSTPPRRVHEPGNPLADKDGYVTYPGLDQAAEMTLMLKTARSYEANIVAMNSARQMYVKALSMGR
jgi:flagellar basal-body rod protein FlgC